MMASAVTVSYDASSSEEEIDDDASDTSHEDVPENIPPVPAVATAELGSNSESDASGSSHEDESSKQGSGLANVMAQILGKKVDKEKKKAPILAKGTTDKELTLARKRKQEEEEAKEGTKKKKTDEEKETDSSDDEEFGDNEKKKLWEEMGRLKPNITDKNRERILQRTATKGVVQLFNAVKKQQKLIDDQLTQVGNSEIRKDKVMKSMTKGKFIDVLKKTGVNVSAEPVTDTGRTKQKQKTKRKPEKEEKEENPSWSILRDDFMMGAKMKDWDKEDDNDGDDDNDDEGGNYSDSDT